MLTNEGQRIGKGGQGFGIPSGLSNRKRLPLQQLLGKNGDERKQTEQSRSGAQDRQIRPLALGLHAQMSTHFMEGDFDRPTQNKPFDDLESIGLLLGTEQRVFVQRRPVDHARAPSGSAPVGWEIDPTTPCQWQSPSDGSCFHTRRPCGSASGSRDRPAGPMVWAGACLGWLCDPVCRAGVPLEDRTNRHQAASR